MKRIAIFLMLLAASAVFLAACAQASTTAPPRAEAQPVAAPQVDRQAIADHYRGKTVTIIVGYAPGGGFDATARVLSRHLGKHIPGNPSVIVENMDGAGSLISANHIYNVAKPDGLTFGTFNELQVMNQLTGTEGVQFDARKFAWIGSAVRSTTACTIRADSPYKTAQDLKRRDLPPLIVGGTAPGANTDDFPKLLNALAGTNMRLVSGYRGTSDIRLATESNEVQGMCWSFESLQATAQRWVDDNFIIVPVYQARGKSAKILERYPNAVLAEDLVTDETSKKLIRAANAPGEISKPFAAPPGTPPHLLQTLREGFWAAVADPELLADVAQARLDQDPREGAEVEQIVGEILSLDSALAKRLAEIRQG